MLIATTQTFRIRRRHRPPRRARLHQAAGQLVAVHHEVRDIARVQRVAGRSGVAAQLDDLALRLALVLQELDRGAAGGWR